MVMNKLKKWFRDAGLSARLVEEKVPVYSGLAEVVNCEKREGNIVFLPHFTHLRNYGEALSGIYTGDEYWVTLKFMINGEGITIRVMDRSLFEKIPGVSEIGINVWKRDLVKYDYVGNKFDVRQEIEREFQSYGAAVRK